MKIMHLSDLHIGLKLFEHSLLEDQAYIFGQIASIAGEEQPDAVVIAGDIYNHAVPSAESVALFDSFLNALRQQAPKAAVMMISGNHDSAERINAFRQVLSGERIWMIGQPPRREGEYIERITLLDEFGPVHFYLLPYVKPSMIRDITGIHEDGTALSYNEALHRLIARETICTAERNILVSHQFYLPVGDSPDDVERMDSEVLRVGNIDLVQADLLEQFEYAALGHIHKPMRVGSDTARYCGTPLACSVSEAGQEKAVLIVEIGSKTDEFPEKKADVTVRRRILTPLRQVRRERGLLEEILERPSNDYVYVELTDTAGVPAADMTARLLDAFPNLLRIARVHGRTTDYSMDENSAEELIDSPLALCRRFLRLDISETADPDQRSEEQDAENAAYEQLLKDIINTVLEDDYETR